MIGPRSVGVTVKVCGEEELVNVSTTGVLSPPPEGVIVMVPVKIEFGVTVKLPDAALTGPPDGPLNE